MNHQPRFATFVAILLIGLLMAGCSSMQPQLEDPEFRLSKVEPLSLGLLEQRFRLTISVVNPNSVALPVRHVSYDVQVAGMDFASGMSNERFTIPARDTGDFTVEATTNLMESLPKLLSMVRAGERRLPYELNGEVEYGRFFRGMQPFSRKGNVQLQF
ncbi:MAG: LEA type 2 family protein [Ectothiorhodospiraceae bacterium]|nr:LEA type 2 family protein [Ectothiorhodospiraceae bacterium]MCH8504190.1 LEA type 2 family protein [Ectothiorhodospiraceae bacterium]